MAASMKVRSFIIVIAVLGLCSIQHASSHGHSHDEPSEPPAHKYSKEANEGAGARGPEVTEKPGTGSSNSKQQHHHQHDHGHTHSHGEAGGHSKTPGNFVPLFFFVCNQISLGHT